MIKMLRIDDRLLHGQVAVTWSKELKVNRIIIVSKSASENEIQKSALQMAAPEGTKAFVMDVDKAAQLLNDPRAQALRILIVMEHIDEVVELLKKLNSIPETLDIANYGRVAGLIGRSKVTDTVYLNDNEKNAFKKLSKDNYKFIYRPLPGDSEKSLDKLLEV
ncbi:PTS sugar transporter subunit IIB [Lactobacillus sp. ESL0791]|uniref:PTS system mannose/fructose/N-acetylgalactosamine-transporter subunit IIB n=1 Tax=Lactobacillus sp. ESL0791 TaxID=2983234 RepID=UPI0023F9F464|nr:PTS sugar transporter subunit IIB [Lactobacillus sp. ESL0791]MDF7637902.1 PTS sugar transporter subunit IIB [Lactobacillus sp. ESL0791]